MKNEAGRVLVDHFYDGIEPLGVLEQRAIAEAPDIDEALMQEMWLDHRRITKAAHRIDHPPSLNIRGMSSARIGDQASNVIPASATATIDARLVKGMDRRDTEAHLIEHVRRQGFFVVDTEPTAAIRRAHPMVAKVIVKPGGYNAVRTPMDLPIVQDVVRAVESARGPTVKIPTMGAGVPLESIEQPLNRTDDCDSDWESRQQPAQLRRESPDSEFMGWDRVDGSALDDVKR